MTLEVGKTEPRIYLKSIVFAPTEFFSDGIKKKNLLFSYNKNRNADVENKKLKNSELLLGNRLTCRYVS